MTTSIGFSSWSLAGTAFDRAVARAHELGCTALEISALREQELDSAIEVFGRVRDSEFTYLSIHAPSRLESLSEAALVCKLLPLARRGVRVVVHADQLHDFAAWRRLGRALCIENLDKRKSTGRTVEELALTFAAVTEARMCFDIAHARQVDGSMFEAYQILRRFRDRIDEVHLSEVSSSSAHFNVSRAAATDYREVFSMIPTSAAVICEYPKGSATPAADLGDLVAYMRRSAEPSTTVA